MDLLDVLLRSAALAEKKKRLGGDGSDGRGESDEAAKAAKAARTEKAEKATELTDEVAGGCTDHGAPSCGADGADREGSADRAKKPAGAAGTGPPVTKRSGSKRGKGHKAAVMPWTPEHREALYIAALAVGAKPPRPLERRYLFERRDVVG